MIKGIGTDIVAIERICRAVEKETFLKRYFTQKEQEFFTAKKNKPETIAAVFAAKEAVAKAMGTGFRGFHASEIEIVHDEKGAPGCLLHGRCKQKSKQLEITKIHVSLSHSAEYATAFAVAEGGI